MAANRFSDLQPALGNLDDAPLGRDPGFISLRWRLVVPLYALILTLAMIAAYVAASTLTRAGREGQDWQMQFAARGAQDGMQALYDRAVNTATRISYVGGVAEAAQAGDSDALLRLLEPEALVANLDALIVVDAFGHEVLGLQRVALNASVDYAVSTGDDLGDQPLVRAMLDTQRSGAAAVLRTAEGYQLSVAWPLARDGALVGQVIVGTRLERALLDLRGSSLTQTALFNPKSGALMQATFRAREGVAEALAITANQASQAIAAPGAGALPVQAARIGEYAYQAAYLPLRLGSDVAGVLGLYVPVSLPYAADLGSQFLGLVMASIAGVIVVAVYALVARLAGRVSHVTHTAEALARGDMAARTQFPATDEIGELGRTLDVYADRVQHRQDSLRAMLRRQRRENARMTAIFEAMPEGVIVQDDDGRVLFVNDRARALLAANPDRLAGSNLSRLTALVTDVLGPALAPGIYTLGEPQRFVLDGRMLSVQAAAILSISGKRIGTVLVLRDISEQVQREQVREELLRKLARDVQEPLLEMVNLRSVVEAADSPLQHFAQEVVRNTVRLQRLVVQLRDLSDLGPEEVEVGQQPLPVEGLLNGLAEEWRPAVTASGLTLVVAIEDAEMFVLGDERRLRWALGNLLDNALKYTLPGGMIRLGARRANTRSAEISVRDSGVGIQPRDLPHVFTRFYRGSPFKPDGTLLRVPGMGQGLFISQRVVEAHGGTLHLDSQPGRGTQVVCGLPLTAPVAMSFEFDLGRDPGGVNPDHDRRHLEA